MIFNNCLVCQNNQLEISARTISDYIYCKCGCYEINFPNNYVVSTEIRIDDYILIIDVSEHSVYWQLFSSGMDPMNCIRKGVPPEFNFSDKEILINQFKTLLMFS